MLTLNLLYKHVLAPSISYFKCKSVYLSHSQSLLIYSLQSCCRTGGVSWQPGPRPMCLPVMPLILLLDIYSSTIPLDHCLTMMSHDWCLWLSSGWKTLKNERWIASMHRITSIVAANKTYFNIFITLLLLWCAKSQCARHIPINIVHAHSCTN